MAAEPEGMVSWLCRLCCGCCCCCVDADKEKHPLLGLNGKPLPKDHEVQGMDFSISEPSSPGGSTPWGSEKQSEASEPPDFGDLEPVKSQPSSSRPIDPSRVVVGEGERGGKEEAEGDGRTSWKLVSSIPQEQQQFIIKIRKQTE